jgi:hypothetical protein
MTAGTGYLYCCTEGTVPGVAFALLRQGWCGIARVQTFICCSQTQRFVHMLMHFKLNGANLRILVEYALRFGLVTKAVRNDLSKSDMSMPMDVCDKERCSTLMQLQANGL